MPHHIVISRMHTRVRLILFQVPACGPHRILALAEMMLAKSMPAAATNANANANANATAVSTASGAGDAAAAAGGYQECACKGESSRRCCS
jgi:hypothetical protein